VAAVDVVTTVVVAMVVKLAIKTGTVWVTLLVPETKNKK
jgi:hypothetical protein